MTKSRSHQTQTDDQRRAYARGYNRGLKRAYDRITQVIQIAKGYRARLTDTAPRVCGTCSRWLRGDGSNNSAMCKWGSCRADFEFGMEGRMWVDGSWDHPKKIITSEDFGCMAWLPERVGAAAEARSV